MINSHLIQNGLLLTGELNFIGLADVFQILGGNNSTGVLHLTSPYAEVPAEVYFMDGNPINAVFGSLKGLDAIYALFGWTEGNFEFRQDKKNPGHAVDHSRMQIVLDALRMLDDGMIKTVGPPRFVDASSSPSNKKSIGADDGSLLVIKGPLVDYMYIVQEEYLSEGDRIVTEGAYGNWVWVILEGRVRITRDTRRGPLALAQLGDGCFIGTFTSFLFSDYVRTATVTAVDDVHLGLLDTQRLAGEFACLSNDFKKFLLALSAKLKTVSDRTIALIGEGTARQEIGAGSHLVSEGTLSKEEIMFYDRTIRPSSDKSGEALLPMTPMRKEDILTSFLFNPSQSATGGPSGIHSNQHDLDSVNMEKMRREYEGLSRTFKNMMDYLATCVATTTTLACQLEMDRKSLTEESGKHRP